MNETIAPLRAARPKNAQPSTDAPDSPPVYTGPALKAEQMTEPKRGPGRPPKPEPLDTIHAIGVQLKPFDRDTRIKILETLLDLT